MIEPFGGQANLLDDSVGDSERRIWTTDCTRETGTPNIAAVPETARTGTR